MDVLGVSSTECDLSDIESVKENFSAIKNGAVVVMGSAVPRLKENSYDSMLKNIDMTENVGRVLNGKNIGQMIFLSSIDVYGCEAREGVTLPLREDSLLHPDDYYALSKVTGEMLLRNHLSDAPLAVLRLPGVYGPGDGGRSLIGRFLENAGRGRPIHVHGDGARKRNYVFVEDIIKVTAEMTDHPLETVVNLAAPESYSVLEIAQAVRDVAGAKVEFKEISAPESRALNIVLDTKKFKQVFSSVETTDIRQGIELYFRNKQESAGTQANAAEHNS